MASIGHVAVGIAAARATRPVGSILGRAVALSAFSLLPDVDVVGFAAGVPYGAPWGHRGATPSLEGSPDTEPARVLRRIRASKDGDLETVQSGFKNDGFVPFACFDGGDETTRFWIVAAKDGGTWRVVELPEVMPKICEGSP